MEPFHLFLSLVKRERGGGGDQAMAEPQFNHYAHLQRQGTFHHALVSFWSHNTMLDLPHTDPHPPFFPE